MKLIQRKLTISCLWEEKVFFNKKKIITKKQNLSENEFFYINTKFKFFGDPRNYSFLDDQNNDSTKMTYLNLKITYFLYYQICQVEKHNILLQNNLKSGRIIDEFINLNPKFGKVQSTKKYGRCEEVIFRIVRMNKFLFVLEIMKI